MLEKIRSQIRKPFLDISEISFTHKKIQIIREDKLCFGMGTKIRKAFGLLEFLSDQQIRKIRLVGALPGNFLSAYSFLFFSAGFEINVYAYNRDPNITTANGILVKNLGTNVFVFPTRKDCFDSFFAAGKKEDQNVFSVPEYGLHFSALSQLNILWKTIKNQFTKTSLLFLEIGSGLSFISAVTFFKNTQVKVAGILIGETEDRFLKNLPSYLKSLHLTENDLGEYFLLKPGRNQKFGKIGHEKEMIREVYRKTGILLEPIYSAKSWNCLQDLADSPNDFLSSKEDRESEWIYLHQGGLLNHLDLLLESEIADSLEKYSL
ncbi:1-aminocyclopropane-1-carboxylate deaminase [Leptospira kobayashii]|uniref:1-aminocyclopropane-1-carboxylate deaminase n=1 Tax=Leptospira kobayashii TaxID=1917830 RepID=A0ABM7URK4_9LEPT|nr:hypothetical protein [Leptospira kobayashii]BDA78886.1 1-aminocyclopropane-1-carboxylate deaminase [Leptospira kobayashii]